MSQIGRPGSPKITQLMEREEPRSLAPKPTLSAPLGYGYERSGLRDTQVFFFFFSFDMDKLITPVSFISVFLFQALICNLLMSSISVHLKVGLFTRPSILFMGLFLHNTLRELSICSQIFFLSNSIFAVL